MRRIGAVLASFGLLTGGCGGNTILVPNLVGEDADYARGVLVGSSLGVDVISEESPDVAEGRVVRTVPSAGEEIAPHAVVTLVVAYAPRFELSGEFVLPDTGAGPHTACVGDGEYSDIHPGTQVRVRDAGGSILGIGGLEGGRRSADGEECAFTFQIGELPKEDFYSLEISDRGGIAYSYDDLATSDWEVSVSLDKYLPPFDG